MSFLRRAQTDALQIDYKKDSNFEQKPYYDYFWYVNNVFSCIYVVKRKEAEKFYLRMLLLYVSSV